MKIVRYSFITILLSLPCNSETRKGSLEVLATDLFGNVIRDASIRLESLDMPPKIMSAQDGKLNNIAFGNYILEVSAAGSQINKRMITVAQHRVFVQVGLKLGSLAGETASYAFSGNVSSSTGSTNGMWLKLTSLFGEDVYFSKPDENTGAFSISVANVGSYELTVFLGRRLCYSTRLSLPHVKRPLHIPVECP
jgi:hypothetical protein